jgi:hypothetical protein
MVEPEVLCQRWSLEASRTVWNASRAVRTQMQWTQVRRLHVHSSCSLRRSHRSRSAHLFHPTCKLHANTALLIWQLTGTLPQIQQSWDRIPVRNSTLTLHSTAGRRRNHARRLHPLLTPPSSTMHKRSASNLCVR